MDILSLLGIEKSIIVLNKCDLVDEEWTELVEEEIREDWQEAFWKKRRLSGFQPLREQV